MKLGDLATVRSGLVLSRKQARKDKPVKMRYPLLSFRAVQPNGYIDMEQLDGFDAAEQLSPEYLTQVGDVIIRLTSPYTAVLIDEASAGSVISSNFVIIRVDRSKLLPGYLVWLINTPKIRKAIYENTSSNMLGAINAKFFSEFEIPPLSILQQQKIAELHLLSKKEAALLRRLSEEKERYYNLLIRNVHSTMKRGKHHDDSQRY
ncbi:MAG: restriction endonuclease subunit S [Clostridiales bacterium]|nr:restriction endonuclease subunit S [Clostridiales bacterium]